jgi:hypothetical protein
MSLLLPLASIVSAQVPDTLRRPKVTIRVVTPPPPPPDTPLIHHIAPDAPLLVELTQKTQLVKAETLFVFSRDLPDVYEGEAIDRRFYDVLQPFYRQLSFPSEEPQLFATYRVELDQARTGYILRVPGMYEPSAIDLWVYDRRMMRFEPPLQLAEAWGDAGAEYQVSGWLVDLDGDGRLDAVLRKKTSYTRMETDSLISQSDSLWVISWANGARTRLLRPVASSLGMVFDPQRWRQPWGGRENADGARFIWWFANRYPRQGNVPYAYVATKDIPSSPDFREVPADSVRSGDLAWWPTFVGLVMRRPPIVLPRQTLTTPTSVRTGDSAFLLDTLIARKGSVKFFRRPAHN